jgi:hypothetical protein
MSVEQSCWAHSLGACDEKMSREHHVSERILKLFSAVSVQGFPWCKEPKEVGIGSLTARHLCTKHNSDLSKTDDAAGLLFEAIRNQFNDDITARQPDTIDVNRNHLERWFLKTAINFRVAGKPEMLWPSGYGKGRPVPIRLVKTAFGRTSFHKPHGLYFHTQADRVFVSEDRITFSALTEEDNVSRAFFFRFRGVVALLWLYDQAPLELKLRFPDEDVSAEHFLYHPQVLNLRPTEGSGGLRISFR